MLETVENCPRCLPSQPQHTFTIDLYHLRIAVSSNRPSFIRWLSFHLSGGSRFRPDQPREATPAHTTRYHVHVASGGPEDDGLHRLISSEDPEIKLPCWGHLQAHTERALTRAARRHLVPYHLIHAGAVAHNGRGILLPARSGSGKSTLVAALALSSFDYYTDEVTILTEEARLLPHPKGITLKQGGWETIDSQFPQARERAYTPVYHEKLHHLAPPRLPPPEVTQAGCGVDFVVFPRYTPEEPTALRPLARAASLARLAESSLNLSLLGKEGFDILYSMIQRTSCYELIISDLSKGVALLEGMLEEAG